MPVHAPFRLGDRGDAVGWLHRTLGVIRRIVDAEQWDARVEQEG
jgi:hypothetical protein